MVWLVPISNSFCKKKPSMLAIREFIDNKKTIESIKEGNIIISEKHFEDAIQLVLKQNMVRNKK